MRTLKIQSLPSRKKWVDRDEIMLHACFQILQDCIDEERVDEACNYEAHRDFVDEIRLLSEWWKKRKLNMPTEEQMEEDDEMLLRLMKVRRALWV